MLQKLIIHQPQNLKRKPQHHSSRIFKALKASIFQKLDELRINEKGEQNLDKFQNGSEGNIHYSQLKEGHHPISAEAQNKHKLSFSLPNTNSTSFFSWEERIYNTETSCENPEMGEIRNSQWKQWMSAFPRLEMRKMRF